MSTNIITNDNPNPQRSAISNQIKDVKTILTGMVSALEFYEKRQGDYMPRQLASHVQRIVRSGVGELARRLQNTM